MTREEAIHSEDQTLTIEQELFHFVPKDMNRCQDLLPGVSRNFSLLWSEDIQKKYRDFIEAVRQYRRLEGHSGQLPEQILTYIQLVRAPFVRRVCETGFNAGHSTFTWLASNPDVHVYSFDIGDHRYSRRVAESLSGMFPGRLTLTWGDSVQTLPAFRKSNPGVSCDVIVVDGGHTAEIAQADMDNFRPMASKTNLVVLDDYPTPHFNKSLGAVWERKRSTGEISELFRCGFRPMVERGFSVGQFTV